MSITGHGLRSSDQTVTLQVRILCKNVLCQLPAQLPSRLSSDCNGQLAECHKIKIVKIEYFF